MLYTHTYKNREKIIVWHNTDIKTNLLCFTELLKMGYNKNTAGLTNARVHSLCYSLQPNTSMDRKNGCIFRVPSLASWGLVTDSNTPVHLVEDNFISV